MAVAMALAGSGVTLVGSGSPMPSAATVEGVPAWTCSGWAPVPAAETSPPASVLPSPSPILPRVIPMAEAWGDVPVRSIPIDLGHGRHFVFGGAATPDGTWLVGTSQPDAFDIGGPVTWEPGDVVLVRVADGAVLAIARLTSPWMQIGSVATDGRWVVWREDDHGPSAHRPRVRLHDRETGTTRDLTGEARKAGARLLDATLTEGHLVLAESPVTSGGRESLDAVVRIEDLRTGAVTTLAEHADHPVASWPWVGWASTDRAEGGPVQVMVTDIETGRRVRLDMAYPALALHGASAVFGTMEHHMLCLVDDLAADAPAEPILVDPDMDHEWLSVNDRAVGLAQRSVRGGELGTEPTQVYDLRLAALIDLPMIVGSSATHALGPLVVWMTPTEHWDDPPDTIRVVDVRDIAP
jgi:hypothetical protein